MKPHDPDESRINILIVDDKPDNLRLLAGILKEKGYKVRQLRHGNLVMPSVLNTLPDIILLDIMMPEMDGYQVCEQLKADPRTQDIPVIFISALNETIDKVKAFAVGGVDFITKPFQVDEVLARAQAHVTLYHTRKSLEAEIEKRKQVEQALRQYTRNIAILNWMSNVLQTCQTEEETYRVIIDACNKLFPFSSGALLMLDESRTLLHAVACWNDPPPESQQLRVEELDAISPEKIYMVEHPEMGSLFSRVDYSEERPTLYAPIFSSEELLAVLSFHFEQENLDKTETNERQAIMEQMLLSEIVDHYALALVNVRLRETLRIESIHDPLTGLYNRRHMEAAFEREAHRAMRHQTSLGMMMFDIDHFKMFNDTHGHEAGDAVLQAIGVLLQQTSRKEDIVCRYGGEEFLYILPDATLEATAQRAERLLRQVQTLDIAYQEKRLQVTISIGVAAFPQHGTDIHHIISTADAALYQAKRNGRNQVVVADTTS